MAGKSNAKTAQKAQTAKSTAAATTTDSITQQPVTPPVQQGETENQQPPAEAQGQEAAPLPTPNEGDQGDGQASTLDDNSQGEGNQDNESPKMALHVGGKVLGGLEPICTIGAEDVDKFSVAVFEAVASLIAGEGFAVRHDGEEFAPFGKDILAASFHQGKGITAVTSDGRKYILSNGEVNEA